ncbi:hypothetical protein GF342_01970 [Candidatus Woesearchaeota archaeon]|nr:hypothetical protein [Candidatus Woesearchaeota archaeon]
MDVWICAECGAEAKKNKPEACPFCGCKDFDKSKREDPSPDDNKYTKLYEDVIDKLEEYNEDCEPFDRRYYSNGE